jgi:AcrR family transcriptional regulator
VEKALAIPSPWPTLDDRARGRDAKRQAVLYAAADMFLRRGYQKTKLADVAERLNITKAALYTYFDSKEAILIECYRLGDQMAQDSVAGIEKTEGAGLDKVQHFIRAYAEVITTPFGMCLNRVDDRELSEDARRKVRGYKRDVDDLVRRLIALGIRDGSMGSTDVRMATFLLLGAINWIGFWYDPAGPETPAQIAERFVVILTSGLRGGQLKAGEAP